jgi:hypothetical protein
MADYFDPGKFGAIVGIPFAGANATTGAENVDMVLAGTGTLIVAPYAGSVVGIACRANAALTAGTITVKAHKASTELADASAPAPVLTTAAQASYATVRPGAVTFAAADTLGVSYSATTTLQATNTIDVDAVLYLQYNVS